MTLSTFSSGSAGAAEPAVGLGTAANFAVLAGSTVTNTGPSVIDGFDVGLSPGSEVTGFPPGKVKAPGNLDHVADAVALQAQNDATTAFNDAAGRPAATTGLTDLGGKTLQPGVYQGDALSLTGTVTLNNNDVPDAVFIFQTSSTLIMSSSSVVTFTNADHPSCNVFWEVGSSAVIGTDSSFVGTLLARMSVSAATGATVQGRLLAKVGAVTLDNNTITRLSCGPTTTVSSSVTPTTPTATTPTAPTPSTSVAVVPPPVTTIPPPRDVTSGSTASIIVPTTPSSPSTPGASTPRTSTTNTSVTQTTGTARSSAGLTTASRQTYTSQSTTTTSTTPGLALTGPPPIAGLTVVGLTTVLGGGVFLAFARSRRPRTGRHHRPAH